MAKKKGGIVEVAEVLVAGVADTVEVVLLEGQVEIELLKNHGNCKTGATRIVSVNEANVLCSESAGVAKIIRD